MRDAQHLVTPQESGVRVADEQIEEWLMELIAGDGYNYGYRKLTVELKHVYKLMINKKKVYRLCNKLRILRLQRNIKSKYPRKLARNRIITGSNQLFAVPTKPVVRSDNSPQFVSSPLGNKIEFPNGDKMTVIKVGSNGLKLIKDDTKQELYAFIAMILFL